MEPGSRYRARRALLAGALFARKRRLLMPATPFLLAVYAPRGPVCQPGQQFEVYRLAPGVVHVHDVNELRAGDPSKGFTLYVVRVADWPDFFEEDRCL